MHTVAIRFRVWVWGLGCARHRQQLPMALPHCFLREASEILYFGVLHGEARKGRHGRARTLPYCKGTGSAAPLAATLAEPHGARSAMISLSRQAPRCPASRLLPCSCALQTCSTAVPRTSTVRPSAMAWIWDSGMGTLDKNASRAPFSVQSGDVCGTFRCIACQLQCRPQFSGNSNQLQIRLQHHKPQASQLAVRRGVQQFPLHDSSIELCTTTAAAATVV